MCCSTSRIESIDPNFRRISEYFDLNVELSSDTIRLSDEITITIIIENKSDSCFYFRPGALLYVDEYFPPNYFTAGDDPVAYYFRSYDNPELVLLEPHKNHSQTFKVVMDKPLVHYWKNKLIVGYMCSSNLRKYDREREYEILYGGLKSSPFEIYVKEK
jgi:hypothetical protein